MKDDKNGRERSKSSRNDKPKKLVEKPDRRKLKHLGVDHKY
jgi:hypothetical protein